MNCVSESVSGVKKSKLKISAYKCPANPAQSPICRPYTQKIQSSKSFITNNPTNTLPLNPKILLRSWTICRRHGQDRISPANELLVELQSATIEKKKNENNYHSTCPRNTRDRTFNSIVFNFIFDLTPVVNPVCKSRLRFSNFSCRELIKSLPSRSKHLYGPTFES